MWHKWWDAAVGVVGRTLKAFTSGPAAASWTSNRLGGFAKGQDNAMWHKWWDGSRWSGWESRGGIIDDAHAAGSWGLNRIDGFARAMNNAMWQKGWGKK